MAQDDLQTLLQFFKVLADENRLKLLGFLASSEHSVEDLAALLQLSPPTTSHHLNKLKELNLVKMRSVGNTHYYSLDVEALRQANKQLLTPEKMASMVVDLEGDAWEHKVIQDFFDGTRLKEIPASRKKRSVVLKWLASQFEYGALYKEAQLNEILQHYHEDASSLRRELISTKEALMQREDGYYWRIPKESWRSIMLRSADRQPLQVWLGIPDGDGPFPAVIELHESPFYKPSVQSQWLSPLASEWVKKGYIYLVINYPAPTPGSYALSFRERIAGNPGFWESEDLLNVRTWLLEQHRVDPKRILLTGWGYSGSMALLTLSKQKERLWSGTIVGEPIINWIQEYSAAEDKKMLSALFRGTPEEKEEQYALSSPAAFFEKVSQPVVILLGENASKQRIEQIEMYTKRVNEHGQFVRVVRYPSSSQDPEIKQIAASRSTILDLMTDFPFPGGD